MFKKYFLYLTLFVSGAEVLVIEIAGARLLAPFYGSTIFVWSSLISVTLGFLALGYFAGGFFADKYPRRDFFYFVIALGGLASLFLVKLSHPVLVFSDKFGFKWGSLVAAFVLFAIPLFLLSMAGPFAIRLTSKETEHAGHASGAVFGISTTGSLAGALLAGFCLVPNFFLSNIFVFSLSALILVCLTGLFIEKAPRRMIAISAGLFAVFLLMPFAREKGNEKISVLHEQPSFYGNIRVIEHLGQRCLEVNSSGQACVSAKDKRQTLPYGQLINNLFGAKHFIAEEKRLENLLVLGLGGGVLARDLKDRFGSVDVVEIDPKIAEIAREYFDYDDENTNIRTHISDARSFVKKSDKKYDVIIVDVFSGASAVPHLFTKESFEEMKGILSPRGMVVTNTIGHAFGERSTLTRSIQKTLNEVFAYNGALTTESVLKNPEGLANILFVSSDQPKDFAIDDEYIVPYKETAEYAKIFTDGQNSIEAMSAVLAGEAQEGYKEFLF